MICVNPITIERNGMFYSVPCGRCFSCVNRYVNDWNLRLRYEMQRHNNVCNFVTLTYNDDNLPKDNMLNKDDIIKFFKRLRINSDREYGVKLKYILTGEYGSLRNRPHYHMLLFGMNKIKSNYVNQAAINIIRKSWGKGFIDSDYFFSNNVNYIFKYIIKDKYDSIGKAKEIKRSFIMSSRKPAIGKLEDKDREKLIDKVLTICKDEDMTLKVGKFNYAIPRYWLKQLPEDVYEVYSGMAKDFADSKLNDILGGNLKNDSMIQYNKLRLKFKKKALIY